MQDRSSTRPQDANQLAKLMADTATRGPGDDILPEAQKNPAAVALGRLGGEKGGKARAAKLTPEKRREIAIKAAAARWKK